MRTFGIITLERILVFTIGMLLLLSVIILNSIASLFFPFYFIYIVSAIIIFFIFSRIDFEVLLIFSPYLYAFSLAFLCLPLLAGEITRGAIRWIQIGAVTIQPSELVRPFILLFFAQFVSQGKWTLKKIIQSFLIFAIPVFLIVIQPSFGVAILTTVGLVGIFVASTVSKKFFFIGFVLAMLTLPLGWFLLAPYQQTRISSFLNPSTDPLGAGYNSLQSMISIGSGRILGRGLGEGVQTQLAFLPEKHSDFVFAAIAEEMGLVGSFLTLAGIFILFWCLITIAERTKNNVASFYILGTSLLLFFETMIHVGMNMGLLPITGVPLPLVSAGGSALLGTMASLGVIVSAYRKERIR